MREAMHPTRTDRHAQRGVVLMIALIVLVAMTLTGIAMMRSIDSGVLIAGNLAARQGAVSAGDFAVEQALAWLTTPPAPDLTVSQPAQGYFANWQNNFDPAGVGAGTAFDWGNNAVPAGTDAAKNNVRYVIHRMCQAAGPASSASCAMTGSGALVASTFGDINYVRQPMLGAANVYYRITARVDGPRHTVTYIQALVY